MPASIPLPTDLTVLNCQADTYVLFSDVDGSVQTAGESSVAIQRRDFLRHCFQFTYPEGFTAGCNIEVSCDGANWYQVPNTETVTTSGVVILNTFLPLVRVTRQDSGDDAPTIRVILCSGEWFDR